VDIPELAVILHWSFVLSKIILPLLLLLYVGPFIKEPVLLFPLKSTHEVPLPG
jgi:hypothetical protein